MSLETKSGTRQRGRADAALYFERTCARRSGRTLRCRRPPPLARLIGQRYSRVDGCGAAHTRGPQPARDLAIAHAACSRRSPERSGDALGYLRVMFTVDDIDEALARLRKHGAQLVKSEV